MIFLLKGLVYYRPTPCTLPPCTEGRLGGWALASQLVNSLVESDWMALLRRDENIRRENQVRGSESLRVAPLITLLCGRSLLTCSLLPWIPEGQPGV